MIDITAVEFQITKELYNLVSEIGKKDPFLRKTTVDDLLSKAKAIAEKMKGHGLGEANYDKFIKNMEMNAERGAQPLLKYITNWAMKPELGVVKEAGQRETVANYIRKLAKALKMV